MHKNQKNHNNIMHLYLISFLSNELQLKLFITYYFLIYIFIINIFLLLWFLISAADSSKAHTHLLQDFIFKYTQGEVKKKNKYEQISNIQIERTLKKFNP